MSVAAGIVAAIVPLMLGVLVLLRSTRRLIGALLIAHAASIVVVVGLTALAAASEWGLAASQLAQGSWVLLFLWIAVIAYLVPDGRALSRGWRAWISAGLIGAVFLMVGAAGDASGFAETHGGAALPIRWLPEEISAVLGMLGLVLVLSLLFGAALAVWLRLRRATGDARLQLLWVVWGASSIPAVLLVLWADYFLLGGLPVLSEIVLALGVIIPVASVAVAILKYRLIDVRVALSATLVYGTLSLLVIGIYALALFSAERLFGSATFGGAVAVVIIAVAAAPVLAVLRRRIGWWVYGYRSEPHEALRLLARRVDAAEEEHLALRLTEAVSEAMRAERVWIERDRPADSDQSMSAPLVHRGRTLGHLVVELPPGRTVAAADRGLLFDLAGYAALLVCAEDLNAELRSSRTRIVSAREEERRRLRRDLHDGVGPSLAAMVLKLGAARTRDDPAERDALIEETRTEVKETITEIRRLVENLQPAAIDQVGLIDAIRQRAVSLSGGILVEVSGPSQCPPLPAAIEVAAFRIASEAITNVARHAEASRCLVRIVLADDALELSVEDNGRGLAAEHATGIGMISMRQRAAEIGGSCQIRHRRDGGVLVHAVLPLRPDVDVAEDSA